ncbi:phage portal protein [Catellatospora sp. NPDC049609]|uniref:phage portal protein n=1 Tax=Catellatospora sp. NPDC049609 TaxID=3155505 RepID=UPI00341F0820
MDTSSPPEVHMADPRTGTPEWWLIDLNRKRLRRLRRLELWRRYYRGEHPLPAGPPGATAAYQDFQRKSRSNFCASVVDAVVHRLLMIGVTDSAGVSDDVAWRWWQLNKLDARQRQVYRTSLSQSIAYAMVGPHPRDRKRPLITAEHPSQVITETDPATGERLAGLKVWRDPRGVHRATVFAEGSLSRYASDQRTPANDISAWKLVERKPSPFGVPIVDFPCRPELGEDPEPEFAGVIDVQDRINLGVLNRMTAERYGAFRQKYVVGHRFKRRVDEATGLEIVESPFRPDPGSLWASEGENTKFGEFSQTELTGYLRANEADIRALFVLTSTPAYYLPGDLINISADTVTALDTNHVAKVGEHQAWYGEGWEEVLDLAAMVAGEKRDRTASEVRWRDPRQLNPAVIADMGTKRRSMGYPLTMVAEDMGDSPQRVNRLRAEAAAEALTAPPAVTGGGADG